MTTAAALRRDEATDAPGHPGLDLVLDIADPRWNAVPDLKALARASASAAFAAAGVAPDVATELGLTFTDDAAVAKLNAEWRGKNGPTNVLSFPAAALVPGASPGALLGDVVLAYQTGAREAADAEKPVWHHLAHLVVHGALHCLGHDHETDAAADAMEAIEVAALARLGIPDPYATEKEPRGA